MKKAKIFLTAITVLTVAGGALAFKAHNAFLGTLKCSTVKDECSLTVSRYDLTDLGSTQYCTFFTHAGNACPNNTFVVTRGD
ncbi:MAG TPA: hypothetical protein VNS58_18080 [Puia sp.]|nr:hypothetical protein [Puia sp.]